MNRPDIHFMIVTLLFQAIMMALICYDWEKTERKFKVKKIIDCIIPICNYAYLIYSHHICMLLQSKSCTVVVAIGAVFCCVVHFWFSVGQMLFFSKVREKYINGNVFGYILLSIVFTLLMGGAILNYVSYMVFPQWYVLPQNLNFVEIGFEFFYYTFNLMITYSGTSIEATHVLAKMMQVFEISIFYVYFGVFFMDLFAKAKNMQGMSEE